MQAVGVIIQAVRSRQQLITQAGGRRHLEREDSLPPFSSHPGPSDGGVSAWGTLSWPIGLAHHLSARTGGRCSSRVGLASFVLAIGTLMHHGRHASGLAQSPS